MQRTAFQSSEVRRLERRLRVLEAGLSVAVALLLIIGLAAMRGQNQQRAGIMRVRGLIVEVKDPATKQVLDLIPKR